MGKGTGTSEVQLLLGEIRRWKISDIYLTDEAAKDILAGLLHLRAFILIAT